MDKIPKALRKMCARHGLILSLEMGTFLFLTGKLLLLIIIRSWVRVLLMASLCMLKFFVLLHWSKLPVKVIMVKSYLLVLVVLLVPRKSVRQQRTFNMLIIRSLWCLLKSWRLLVLHFLVPSSQRGSMLVVLLKFLLILRKTARRLVYKKKRRKKNL